MRIFINRSREQNPMMLGSMISFQLKEQARL